MADFTDNVKPFPKNLLNEKQTFKDTPSTFGVGSKPKVY